MENESRKSRNKTLQKVLLAVLSIILMTGIAFFMANVVHNNSSQPTSSKVKNGLSAYELAVEQGYKGNLNDWLKSLDGKSAFEIAKENGYSGTEKEWNKAVANVSNQNKSVITNAGFNKNGDFILTLLDGTDVNVSNVSNSKGKDGTDGKNGTNGKNGANGKDGRSITLASVNSEGQLVITYSDGSSVNLDKLVGINGIDGKDGTDGKDGVGINTVNITEDGKLNITLTNGTTLNLGTIKGEKGDKGDTGVQGEKGDKGDTGEQGIQGVAGKDGINGTNGVDGKDGTNGKDGVGIANVLINTSGELELTFSDGQQINLGNVKGSKGEKGDTGEQGIQGATGKDGANGQDGVGIANVTVSNEGALSVTLTNGTVLDLGNIKGTDGIGISKSEVNVSGELVLTYTDGTVKNLGNVVGANGADGQDGVGIKTVTLSSTGELMVTLSDNSVINLGNVKGEKGDKGDKGDAGVQGEKGEKGDKGDTGRGIAKTELINGELIITYTDGTKENLGSVSNAESEYSSGLQYTLNEDNNSYTLSSAGELFNSTKVVIPETYKGKPVTKIGERAFYSTQLYGSDSSKGAPINELILPSTIKSIALEAFYNCKIEKVVFEGTIEEWCSIQFVGASANPLYHPDNAKDNTKLYIDGELIETLVIPNSVSTISSYSFIDCGSLKEVVIPESVTSIEPLAFKNCGSLSSVEVKAPRGWYYKNGGYKYSISESTMSNKTLLAQKFVEGNPSNYYKD
ncbi:MAG: leucine-rich repeat protein [Eubacterium sp.]